MRNYFKSKEQNARQLVKNRLRNRRSRRLQREKVLRELKLEVKKTSAGSKLAESLAALVVHKDLG